jgi:MFS family permease
VSGARSRWWLLASVLFGLLSTNITFTVFNVALVNIAQSLRTTPTTLTWAITGPLLVVGIAAPIVGKIGDVHGHRRLYLFGLIGSLVCAIFTAAAWNAGSLIAARLFSGLEGACTAATSWALLFRVFGPGERTQVLGWWCLVGAGGPVIGVAVGGPVVESFGWRWLFIGQIPLIVIALITNYRMVPETDRSSREPLDIPGAILLAVGIGALLLALNEVSHGLSRPIVPIAAAVSVAGLVVFAVLERRSRSPVFPLEWLGRREFILPSVAAFAMNFAYMGGFFLTPLFLEQALHYSIGTAGLLQIARPLTFAIAAPAAGYVAARTGEKAAALVGGCLLTLSMLTFVTLRPGASPAVIVLALAASGLANGIAVPALSAVVANSVEIGRMGSASAGMQVVSQVGIVAGIQVMETVQASRQHLAGLVGSFQDAYAAGAVVTLLAVASAVMIRPVRHRAGFTAEPLVDPVVG